MVDSIDIICGVFVCGVLRCFCLETSASASECVFMRVCVCVRTVYVCVQGHCVRVCELHAMRGRMGHYSE